MFDLSFIPWDKEITLTHWLAKIVGDAMQFFERLRSVYREDRYFVYPDSNIGLAIAVGDKLYVPVYKKGSKEKLEGSGSRGKGDKEKGRRGKVKP